MRINLLEKYIIIIIIYKGEPSSKAKYYKSSGSEFSTVKERT